MIRKITTFIFMLFLTVTCVFFFLLFWGRSITIGFPDLLFSSFLDFTGTLLIIYLFVRASKELLGRERND